MSEPTRPHSERTDEADISTGDPDRGSTWSTIDNTAEVEDLLNEEDLENFLVAPILDPQETSFDRDESQDPQAPLIPDPLPRFDRQGEP